jgi:2-methylisocitrate lyase-like PEP mutase family enzyme
MTTAPAPAAKTPRTPAEKGAAFRALHQREGAFIIPNPYDAGTALLLEQLGFEALATTSSGFAATLGQLDHGVTRNQVLEHVRVVTAATNLPLSGDLENGFGDAPEAAAETIRLAAAAGLSGGSIEDSTGRRDTPVYELAHAVDRVRAAVEAARSLPYPFVLTARAENLISGRPDLADTIRRLQAFQEAGADVLFAPGVATNEDIAAVVRSVDRPVNVMIGMPGMTQSFAQMQELGVKRISVGGALSGAALGGFMRAAREMREQGTFTFVRDGVRFRDLAAAFRK